MGQRQLHSHKCAYHAILPKINLTYDSHRSKLSELLAENDAARYEAEQYKQQLRVKQQELETSTISLADEQVG